MKWKVIILSILISITLSLFFIPIPKESDNTTLIYYKNWSLEKGFSYEGFFPLQWRSFNQKIEIYVNLTQGKISIEFLQREAFFNMLNGQSYDPLFSFINITLLDHIIYIGPPLQEGIYFTIKAEEDSIITLRLKLDYMYYLNNYGFVFMGISVILILYYGYKRYKGA